MQRNQLNLHALARHCLCAWLAFTSGGPPSVFAQTNPTAIPPGTLLHDFDHDGVKENLISRPGTNEIQRWVPANKAWEKADYALPADVWLVDDAGKDAGLRFVDLNGDGFDDILFSNPQQYAIHLWTKNVRPELGPRSDIAAMELLKLSRMPAGLESALKPQDMADLLRWLQAP